MKIKNAELTEVIRALNALSMQKLDIQLAWDLGTSLKSLMEKHEQMEQLRLQLCREHCDKDEDGNTLMIDGRYSGLDDNKEFIEEVTELLQIENEFNVPPISFQTLVKNNIKLTTQEVEALKNFIVRD